MFSSGSAVTQDNTNLFFDNTNNRLGIQTATPSVPLDVNGQTKTNTLSVGSTLGTSAIFDVTSTTLGVLDPRMTAAQRDVIGTPATGLRVYNTDTNKINWYNGTAWQEAAPLTSPTFVTPVLGAATGTSLGLGGALDASASLGVTSTTKGVLDPRMTQAQRDAIGTPATGLRVFNTDSGKFNYYNGSAWTEVGSGSSGVNYIVDNDGSAIGSWVTYKDAAGTSPVDGTGGSPTVTYAISTSSALRGTSNFLFTHGASNQQGEGFSIPFTIDPSDKGKVLQISLEYLIASGTYADDDLQFWIYDVTNAALIQPAPFKLKNSGIIEKFAMEFQTSSSSGSYRLIGHVATTTATAYTIRFDSWTLGPQAKLYGSPITDWVSYTPTGGLTTNTTYTGKWRRVGDSMEIVGRMAFAGAANATTATLNLPSGYSIDTNKINGSEGGLTPFGVANGHDSGGQHTALVVYNSTTSVVGYGDDGAGAWNNTTPFTVGAGDYYEYTFKIPIVGWSSSTIMSSDAATNVVAASMTNTEGTSVGSLAVIPFANTSFDTVGGWNGTDTYTVKVPGKYKVSSALNYTYGAYTAANYISIGVYKNGSTLVAFSAQGANATASNYIGSVISGEVDCIAGDTLQIKARNDGSRTLETTAGYNTLNIERISGPAQIATSETVAARYTTAATQSIANGAEVIIDFGTKDFDYQGAVTTGASWKYSAQISGLYRVSVKTLLASGGGWAAGEYGEVSLHKNGSISSRLCFSMQQATHSNYVDFVGGTTIRLLAGDYVDVRIYQISGAAIALEASASHNYIEITRIGN